MLTKIKRKISKICHKFGDRLYMPNANLSIRNARNQFEDKWLQYDLPEITDDELAVYRNTWPMWDVSKEDLTWARVYKKYYGFSPYIIGNWHTWCLRERWNPYAQLAALEHKAMMDVYFPELQFPEVYVRKVGDNFYDRDMKILSIKQVVNLLCHKDEFIIKPAWGSNQGAGVRKITKADESTIQKVLNQYDGDFVAQEVLHQHPDIARLNPASLNTCRVTSVYIDGQYGAYTSLKIGKEGSILDNWFTSYFCGVGQDGVLQGFGHDKQLKQVTKTDNGITLRGIKLPCYEEMIAFIEEKHKKYFPNCGIVGWDVVIDSQNRIRVIELNLTTPGIVIEQLATGDFLKDFRDTIVSSYNK